VAYVGTADATNVAKLTNKNNMDEYTDSTAACSFGITAPTGELYVLEQFQVFFNKLNTETDRAKISGKLKF